LKKLRVLIVEDQTFEAELLARAIEKGGYDLTWTRVETETDYQAALESAPDIILADYSLPQFSGPRALTLLKQSGLDIPFILVSGSIGEENAAEVMRLGADDYLPKSRLQRLIPVIRRALQEAQERAAHRAAQAALREAEERFRSFTRHLPGRAAVRDLEGRYTFVNEAWLSACGMKATSVLERTYDELFPDGRRAAGLTLAHQEVAETDKPVTRVFRSGAGDQWWLSTHFPIRDAGGKTTSIGTVSIDVTEQMVQKEKIARLTRIHAVLSGINSAIVRMRDRQALFDEACRIAVQDGGFSLAWIGMLNAGTQDIHPVACAGIEAESFLAHARDTSRADARQGGGLAGQAIREKRAVFSNDLLQESSAASGRRKEAIRRGLRSAVALPLLVEDVVVGNMLLCVTEANFFNDDELRLLTDLAADISFALDHISKAEKLEYLAYYDALTGLANRTLFHERLEQAVAAASRENRKLALVVQDIERFKALNDTLGRQAGDILLRQIAQRMSSVATDSDWLGRIGADHFAILVPDVTTEEDLARRAEQRMRRIYGQPFRVGDVDMRVAARMGIAVYPADGADADALFRNAEAAVKKAKESGDRMLFYTQAMTERVAEKLNLENKLRNALENGEFVLHFQPKVHLQTRAILGVEALIRWQSAEFGLVPPADFIPLLEETGLILDVGVWAIRSACHEPARVDRTRHCRAAGGRQCFGCSDAPARLCFRSGGGAAPCRIAGRDRSGNHREPADGESARQHLEAAGGSGARGRHRDRRFRHRVLLARLPREAPVQALKIDRSFVSSMLLSPQNMAIVSTIISLAHSLELTVIAEGVESEEQAKLLNLLKCDEMQGYLVSKPIPSEGLCDFLRCRDRPQSLPR
jgi:diguanylate cyclase (GGDEF)-like protein/PAS domain S-box-containing protein